MDGKKYSYEPWMDKPIRIKNEESTGIVTWESYGFIKINNKNQVMSKDQCVVLKGKEAKEVKLPTPINKPVLTIADLIQKAQYCRIDVGNRRLICGHPKWVVIEFKEGEKKPIDIIRTEDEGEAVQELLKGEPLYADLVLSQSDKELIGIG